MSICTESTRGPRRPVLQVVVAPIVFVGQRVNLQEKYDYPDLRSFSPRQAVIGCSADAWARRSLAIEKRWNQSHSGAGRNTAYIMGW